MDMEMITDLMEAVMILCFGLSWPISIRKSWVSRTAKGKSLFFECFIWIGYVFGIARKFMQLGMGVETSWLFYLAWFFYFLNIAEITIDILLYFRNVKLDKERDAKQALKHMDCCRNTKKSVPTAVFFLHRIMQQKSENVVKNKTIFEKMKIFICTAER